MTEWPPELIVYFINRFLLSIDFFGAVLQIDQLAVESFPNSTFGSNWIIQNTLIWSLFARKDQESCEGVFTNGFDHQAVDVLTSSSTNSRYLGLIFQTAQTKFIKELRFESSSYKKMTISVVCKAMVSLVAEFFPGMKLSNLEVIQNGIRTLTSRLSSGHLQISAITTTKQHPGEKSSLRWLFLKYVG